MRVLIVDDSPAFTDVLIEQLQARHYIVDRVTDGETGWVYGVTYEYDLIISEWILPKLSGLQLCKRLRSHGYSVPFLLLTRKNKPDDKVHGLEAGADDYVVKPCNMTELMVRIQVLLRRAPTEATPLLVWGDLCLDSINGEVTYQGYPLTLTAKEYLLLELFFRHSDQLFSAKNLLDRLWPSEKFPSEATVRSHIRGLRKKLQKVGASPDMIETVHGMGYRLQDRSVRASGDMDALSPPLPPHMERQAQYYLEGITQAWEAHKAESWAHWNYLIQLAQALKAQADEQAIVPVPEEHGLRDQPASDQQTEAHYIANRLAGTLGTFGLTEGYRLALQVKAFLQESGRFSRGNVSAAQASQFHTLVTALGHAMDEPPQLAYPAAESLLPPSILLVDTSNAPYAHQLAALALAQGFAARITHSLESVAQILSLNALSWSPPPTPFEVTPFDIVIVNFISHNADLVLEEVALQPLLQLVAKVHQRWPDLPVLAVVPQADFANRLELVRKGVAVVMEYPVVPAEVLEAVLHTIYRSYRLSKIMVVDDDARCIQQMLEILQPWDFQITPLTNPQQFWTVFTQVAPDLVILDIEMPQISGLELCQVLRSSPQWQRLPIILLSDPLLEGRCHRAHPAGHNPSFILGADDCIAKPIQAADLAYRVLNRLKRSQI